MECAQNIVRNEEHQNIIEYQVYMNVQFFYSTSDNHGISEKMYGISGKLNLYGKLKM